MSPGSSTSWNADSGRTGSRSSPHALPVIVLTALDEARRRAIGAEWAAADVMTKPFSLAALAARVRAQIDLAARVRVELS